MGRKPFCHDCKRTNAHVVSQPNGGQLWLCGSCEALRNKPNLRLANEHGLPATWPVKAKSQKERLF